MATLKIMDSFAGARIPKWLRLTLAVVVGMGAAYAFMRYFAYGREIGHLIGRPGREHDIAIAQHRGSIALLSGVLLQFGVAGALFGYMEGEDRYNAGRILRAVLVSLVVTWACGVVIFYGLRALG
jgi:hypothetical protein